MKSLLPIIILLSSLQSYAQTQDLVSLAQGDYLGMNALFDENDDLFGYISMYDQGKSGEKTKKFEYVILDKNLNPFANNTFDGDITAGDYYGYINFNGYVVLKPSAIDKTFVKSRELFTPSSMIIDLKDNTVKRKVYYEYDHGTFTEIKENNTWKENREARKQEKKKQGFVYNSSVFEIKEGGYLVHDYDLYRTHVVNNRLLRYDENKQKLWEYEYNIDATKAKYKLLYIIEKDEKYLYALLRKHRDYPASDRYDPNERKRSADPFFLLVLDMKTGKEVHLKEIPDPEGVMPDLLSFETFSYGELDNDKIFDDKIIIVGTIPRTGYYISGITRLIINKKTFEADLKLLFYNPDFEQHLPNIKSNGMIGKGYFIDPRDIFFMKDGSVSILFEKYKPSTEYTAQKTTDIVLVKTDTDFKIQKAFTLEKEKSKWMNSDYLFSQNLNEDKDLVFFYRDYQPNHETKTMIWNLFINTIIDGDFKQEMIPISSKENYVIIPYIAKQGYILLHEYNKKAKYNQVRLERLDY